MAADEQVPETPDVADGPDVDEVFIGGGSDSMTAAHHARRALAGAWGTVSVVLDEYGDAVHVEVIPDGNTATALELARRTADLAIDDGLRPFAVRCTSEAAQVTTLVQF